MPNSNQQRATSLEELFKEELVNAQIEDAEMRGAFSVGISYNEDLTVGLKEPSDRTHLFFGKFMIDYFFKLQRYMDHAMAVENSAFVMIDTNLFEEYQNVIKNRDDSAISTLRDYIERISFMNSLPIIYGTYIHAGQMMAQNRNTWKINKDFSNEFIYDSAKSYTHAVREFEAHLNKFNAECKNVPPWDPKPPLRSDEELYDYIFEKKK